VATPSYPPDDPAHDGGPGFLARVDLVRGRLTAVGRLHRGTAHLFHDAVSALVLSARKLWTIDVTNMTVSDNAGLRSIGNAYRRAVRLNRRLTLIGASPALRQTLVRLRLDHHVIETGPDSATDAGSTPSAPRDDSGRAGGAGRRPAP